jgi:GT2 family glycosyltransferase
MRGIVGVTELSIIVPTHRRPDRLRRTLDALGPQAAAENAEVIVVDDASGDSTPDVLAALERGFPCPLRTVTLDRNAGPGAARNAGVAIARAPVLLFFGDDIRPAPEAVARHRAFHHNRPEPEDALLGRIVPGPDADSPFARWLHEQGKQFAFAWMTPGEPVPATLFYAANSSLKRELFDRAGGFDERFRFGHEEQELSHRLEAAGLRLAFDPDAMAEHDHPTDLRATLARMRVFGASYRLLTETAAAEAAPRRPGHRHRAKAAALTALSAVPGAAGREATWAFLCEEAHREGYWEPDAPVPAGPPIRIGSRLARRAERDPAVRPEPDHSRQLAPR